MNIREGKHKDVKGIADLVEYSNDTEESPIYEGFKVNRKKTERSLTFALNDRFHQSYVMEVDGKIVGALVVVAHQHPFSVQRVATEVYFYVMPEHRGYGGALLRRYVSWGRKVPGIIHLWLGVSSGVNIERTEKIIQILGGQQVGSSYIIDLREAA